MIRAELRRLHSPDALDLEHYVPENPEFFGLLVQAMIGSRGSPGEDSFDFMVCTPEWLHNELSRHDYLFGWSHLFVPRYDYNVLWRAIDKLCTRTAGPDWESVATRLARFGAWEFDDYRT